MGINLIGNDDGRRATYARVYKPDHPVAPPSGHVRVNRVALYEKIGHGPHSCEWCGKSIRWSNSGKVTGDYLVADHIDGDPSNNSMGNLVPACNPCNSTRSRGGPIQDGETVYSKNGLRQRGAIIACKCCSVAFISPITTKMVPTRSYCSPKCARTVIGKVAGKAMQEARKLKSGVPFELNYDGSKRRTFPHVCLICTTEFFRRKTKKEQLYCSRKCYLIARRRKAGIPDNPTTAVMHGILRATEERKCEWCEKPFVYGMFSRNPGKFCSRSCSTKSYNHKRWHGNRLL